MIVIHYTAMKSSKEALRRLCNPVHEVSAHYFIEQDGAVTQLVGEAERAWHAGVGCWGDCCDVNSSSIGIELCNTGTQPFPKSQILVLKKLLRELMERWAIPTHGIIGHSDMAPGRKQDPGRLFDWKDLADEGLAVFRGCSHAQILPFMTAAKLFGYSISEPGANLDEIESSILEAFRQRFRPNAVGPLCNRDIKVISNLGQSYPFIVNS
ncbi:MAG: N-acetylmuramoyl-L-alanine amidase [Planktomarina sp.]|nr:N-acetylmuramoyl-L-alanine amidase [Planktomarina sp.]